MHNKYSMTGDVRMEEYLDMRCYNKVRFILTSKIAGRKKSTGIMEGYIWKNKIGGIQS